MFMNNKNIFQPVNNHTETSEITIPTTTQSRKQPRRRLVPESDKMKKKAKTQKKITVDFPKIAEDLPPLEIFIDLSVPSEARKN